jgi:hypothetical protein
MTPGGRPRGGSYNGLAWIDTFICIYSMVMSSKATIQTTGGKGGKFESIHDVGSAII